MADSPVLDGVLAAVREQLERWKVASASLAVVRNGEVLFAGGLGARDGAALPADGRTLYPIASCSKAFTATALGILATEGRFDFDVPVIEYLPGFRLHDRYATENLTMRDFLCHRSGLPRHEMAWYGTGFGREELLTHLKDLPFSAPIRYRFQYCNFNYLIAGAVIEAITGQPFETFLYERLLKPLGMTHSLVYGADFRAAENRALAFDNDPEYTLGTRKQIPYYCSPAEDPNARVGDPTAAAGCIVSCAEDMTRWLRFNLDRGRVGETQLVREDLMDQIATIHMFQSEDCGPYAPQRSSEGYALGWSVYQYRGRKMVEHGGNINGFTATTLWLPKEKIGVFVDVNHNVSFLADAISHSVVDALLGTADTDWYGRMFEANAALFRQVDEIFRSFAGTPVPDTVPSHPISAYAGRYEAPGYRRILITETDGGLTLDFNHWVVGLKHHHYDSFATVETLGEFPPGVILRFETDAAGAVRSVAVKLGTEQGLQPIVFLKEE